jgi:hypothetical protein
MYFTGFADEAAADLDGQIRATRTLGRKNIEAGNVNGSSVHDLPEADFDAACGRLQEAALRVNCFGSAIANWDKTIQDQPDSSLAEARCAIPRMQRLGVKLIRAVSFAVIPDRGPEEMTKIMDEIRLEVQGPEDASRLSCNWRRAAAKKRKRRRERDSPRICHMPILRMLSIRLLCLFAAAL